MSDKSVFKDDENLRLALAYAIDKDGINLGVFNGNGTAVKDFAVTDTTVTFKVEGFEDAQITVQLEDDCEYEVFEDGVGVGGMKTNMSGKLSLSVELNEGREVEVKIVRK